MRADHDGRRRGAGERVVDALRHGECLARGRIVGEQIAAAERLHHRDTHAHALAGFVQLLTGGVEVEQRLFIAFLVEQLFHILVAGEKVVAGIDGEHEYLDESALDRLERNERVVAAHAYVQNFALRLQLLRIFHDLPFRDFLPRRHRIDVMDHPHVDVVGAEVFEHGFKGRDDFAHVARRLVLPVLPRRTQVRLIDELPAVRRNFPPDAYMHIGIRTVQIHDIDAFIECEREHLAGEGFALIEEAFAAETDLAHVQAGFSQSPVLHLFTPCRAGEGRAAPLR